MSSAAYIAPNTSSDPVGDSLYRKIAWRIMPILVIGYIIAYIDRVNVSFAKLQMLGDLKFSDSVYGVGAGIIFLGYFAFEIPSNIILHKVGAPPVPDHAQGWKNCYLTHAGSNGDRRILVGVAGHKKWAAEHRKLQIGVVLVPEYHGQHLGEEVVGALGKWGLDQSEIDRVICDVPDDHQASAKSLERAGFTRASERPAVGFTRFELKV